MHSAGTSVFLDGSRADGTPFLLQQESTGLVDVSPSDITYPSGVCEQLPCNGATGALCPNVSMLVCAPSSKSAMCARADCQHDHQRVKFETIPLDMEEEYTALVMESGLPLPSPFHYISVGATIYFLATNKVERPTIYLGGVATSAGGALLHQHFITELRSQARNLRDVCIGPTTTAGAGKLLVLSVGTTVYLAPLSSDFGATKEELTTNSGLQSLDWSRAWSGGNAALGRTCPSAWQLLPDKGSNSILVVCEDRMQQLKIACNGPNFTRCFISHELRNASKLPSAPVAILHDADNAGVCYITQDEKGWLSTSTSAFPSTLGGLTSAPLVDEETKKVLRAKGPLCIPPDGQGCTAFFINQDDGELYKLMMVDGELKCKNLDLGNKCDSCNVNTCQMNPETVALSDNRTGLITIFDVVTKEAHSTAIPATSILSLFGWPTEKQRTTIPDTATQESHPDPDSNSDSNSDSGNLGLQVGLPAAVFLILLLGIGIAIIATVLLKMRRKVSSPIPPIPVTGPILPIPCTEKVPKAPIECTDTEGEPGTPITHSSN